MRVELYANGVNGDVPVRQEMKRVRQLVGAAGGYAYSARVDAPGRRPIIQRARYRVALVLRFPSKPLVSYGSGDSICAW